MGKPDYALVIKDLNKKTDLFVLNLSDILQKNKSILSGSFDMGKWTPDGKYLWGDLFSGPLATVFYRIEAGNWNTQLFVPPDNLLSGVETDFSWGGYLAYADVPSFVGGDADLSRAVQDQARAEGKSKNLWIYALLTGEKTKIASADPGWDFNPKWTSEAILQYRDSLIGTSTYTIPQ